jgi:hypothetical protein
MIKKAGNKYVVVAESGRRMGTYDTKAEAQKRLRQVEFFKHAKTGGGSRRRSAWEFESKAAAGFAVPREPAPQGTQAVPSAGPTSRRFVSTEGGAAGLVSERS